MTNKRDALRSLRAKFIEYWPDLADLPPLLSDAGIDATRIDTVGTPNNVWHRVVIEAIKSGRLDALVGKAVARFPEREAEFEEARDNYNKLPGEWWIGPEDPHAYPLNDACPYPGLRKFKQTDRPYFFGRDELTRELLEGCRSSNLILVWGHSGSGKSSVVRAGLIPQWAESVHDARARPIVLTPDINPFEGLYLALGSIDDISQADAAMAKKPSGRGLTEAVKTLKPEKESWLIFVDQFEELFTRVPQSHATLRDKFIASIVDLANSDLPDVRIVLAMRDDFFGHLREYPQLFGITDRAGHRVTEMDEASLVEVIERPAAEHGVAFEEGVVKAVTEQVRSRRGMLPLLQYSLRELWNAERDDEGLDARVLRLSTYEKIGGVEGALREKAKTLYARLTKPEREGLRRIMLCTVEIGATQGQLQPVSRKGRMSEVGADDKKLLSQLVDVEKLLVTSGEEQSEFELPHEAIIGAWPEFEAWVQESQEAIQLRNRLTADADTYKQLKGSNSDRASEELWRGAKLTRAIELSQQSEFQRLGVPLSEDLEHFLNESRSAHDADQERRLAELEQARNDAEQKANTEWEARVTAEKEATKRHKRALYVVGGAFVAGLIALGWGLYQMKVAVASANELTEYQNTTEDEIKALKEDKTGLKEKVATQVSRLREQDETIADSVDRLLEMSPVLSLSEGKVSSREDVPKVWRDRLSDTQIASIADSVCCVRVGNEGAAGQPPQPRGTGFVVGPNLIATMAYVAKPPGPLTSEDVPNLSVTFADTHVSGAIPVAGVAYLGMDDPEKRGRAIAILEVENLDLDLHPPLRFSAAPASEVENVAMFGYPLPDMRQPKAFREQVFGNRYGTKCTMLGTQPRVDVKGRLLYDGFSSGGCAGGPVVDLSTGAVVGVHWASWFEEQGEEASRSATVITPARTTWSHVCEAVPSLEILENAELQRAIVPAYDPDFFAEGRVPRPVVPARLKGDLLNGRVINATHYSFEVNEGRAMPFYVAYNIDRAQLKRIPYDVFRIDPKLSLIHI